MNKKIIVLIGCAPGWEIDLSRFASVCQFFDIGAIGLDCPYEGKIDYFFTYHPEDIKKYEAKRKANGLSRNYLVVSHTQAEEEGLVDITIRYQSPSGSSAMLGTLFALETGYEKIILCGCPLTGFNRDKISYSPFQEGWMARKSLVIGKVKSLSGWTSEFLGTPTEEWLKNI